MDDVTERQGSDLIDRTANHVRTVLSGDGTGHDWWHVHRVWRTAQRIGRAEKANLLVVELAALLHDIADWKLNDGDSMLGPKIAREWLDSLALASGISEHVCQIIANISFKGVKVEQPTLSLEGKVVQDADRLDAMGAIGIARALAYGGAKGREIYDPTVKPTEHRTAEAYLKGGTTINHFYEKLLLLKGRMNTVPARFGFDPKTDIQVLSPMNRSLLGARNLNQVLQTALNPGDGGPEVQRFGWTFRIGDRVIQTENDYNRDVFNGDLGMIEKINRIEQDMVVNFEGRQVEYDFGDLDELALAYVLSIHKSQGSEFPCVVIPVHTQHYMMLQRNLLYTAVTRGKKLVILVGTKKALGMAVRRQDTSQRYTALRGRLGEA